LRADVVPEEEYDAQPVKRQRGEHKIIPLSSEEAQKKDSQPKSSLGCLPDDIMTHCLSFLGSNEDRFALQCTSKQFRRISNMNSMKKHIRVGGDRETGKNGIIQEDDTPETASKALMPFALANNLEAIYMIGIIKSYCHQDVEGGIHLLKITASGKYARGSYALGLVLRDTQPEEAARFMKEAADAGYLPALQELLPAREMKAKYGEPNADLLRQHLDPICLNRLLSRHYVQSKELRELNTSHCWNPHCGRWAFKATYSSNGRVGRSRMRSWGFSLNRRGSDNSNTALRTSSGREDLNSDMDAARFSTCTTTPNEFRVSRMKMCSRCCRAKYCSKLCQVYDWRSGRHKMECQFL